MVSFCRVFWADFTERAPARGFFLHSLFLLSLRLGLNLFSRHGFRPMGGAGAKPQQKKENARTAQPTGRNP